MLLSVAMEKTTMDLLTKFGAVTGFVQSDEITLVFPPIFKEEKNEIINNQIFGGRTQKLTSLSASYASIRFNCWLNYEFTSSNVENTIKYNEMIKDKIGRAWFDSRVFGVPTKEDVFNVVCWRYRDTIKNSKSMFAQAYCSHKSLLNKNGKEQIEYCLETSGKDWNESEDRFKYGIFVKKEKFLKPIEINGIRQSNEMVERSRVTSFCKNSFEFSKENVDMLVEKFIMVT